MEVDNLKVLSIGMLVDERQAIVWRGPMVSSALRQFIQDVLWKLDYLIIDLPPGTGDVQLSLLQYTKINGVVLVTTPQRVALADARKAIGMFQMEKINVPILGVVENMAWFSPTDKPEERYFLLESMVVCIWPKSMILSWAPALHNAYSRTRGWLGVCPERGTDKLYHKIAGASAQMLAIRNAQTKETFKLLTPDRMSKLPTIEMINSALDKLRPYLERDEGDIKPFN